MSENKESYKQPSYIKETFGPLLPSELLKVSEKSFNEAIKKVEQLEEILIKLINLKEYKDINGKDDHYKYTQPKLWKRAKYLIR